MDWKLNRLYNLKSSLLLLPLILILMNELFAFCFFSIILFCVNYDSCCQGFNPSIVHLWLTQIVCQPIISMIVVMQKKWQTEDNIRCNKIAAWKASRIRIQFVPRDFLRKIATNELLLPAISKSILIIQNLKLILFKEHSGTDLKAL